MVKKTAKKKATSESPEPAETTPEVEQSNTVVESAEGNDRSKRDSMPPYGWTLSYTLLIGTVYGIVSVFSSSARTWFVDYWIWIVLFVVGINALAFALSFFPRLKDWFQRASGLNKFALIALLIIPPIFFCLLGVVLLPGDWQNAVLRAAIILLVSLLPPTFYFLFMATSKHSLLSEFTTNLRRLGLLEAQIQKLPDDETRIEPEVERRRRVDGYLKKFETVYGKLSETLKRRWQTETMDVTSLEQQSRSPTTIDPGTRMEAAFDIFKPSSALPILFSTVLIAIGWLLVLPPRFTALENRTANIGKPASAVEARDNDGDTRPEDAPPNDSTNPARGTSQSRGKANDDESLAESLNAVVNSLNEIAKQLSPEAGSQREVPPDQSRKLLSDSTQKLIKDLRSDSVSSQDAYKRWQELKIALADEMKANKELQRKEKELDTKFETWIHQEIQLQDVLDRGWLERVLEPPTSPVLFAFLGAYFFSLQMLFRRFVRQDLRASAYANVAIRIILALIGAWVLSVAWRILPWLANNSEASQYGLALVAFVVGVFPLVLWQVIREAMKNVAGRVLQIPSLTSKLPLSDLDGLTVWHEARLQEEDIENIPNMATTDIVELMLNTRYPAERIVDWVDQAILYPYLPRDDKNDKSKDWRNRLRDHGVRTATALIRTHATTSDEDEFKKILVQAAGPPAILGLLEAIYTNPNLVLVQRWRRRD